MDKSSNIKRKSTKIMLIVYRAFLKFAFAFLILAGAIVFFDKNINLQNNTLIFTLSSSIIFAISYLISYYLYKFYNKNKFERIKKSPLKMQILLMCRFLIFIFGSCLFILGMSFIKINSFAILLALFGLILSELLFANKRLFSHLSTFFENCATGILFIAIYLTATQPLNFYVLYLWLATLFCLLLQEVFYFYTNIQHSNEKLEMKEMLKIRLQYFSRNALLYTIFFIIITFAGAGNIYKFITSSTGAIIFFQLLPMIISVITVVVLLYTSFHKASIDNSPNFNTITDRNTFKTKLDAFSNQILDDAYEYVVNTMNTKNGYTRKSGEDYYYHCLNVANILIENGITNINSLACALLHDCIEDIPNCNAKFISELTNDKIAHSVVLVTKDADTNYKIDNNLEKYLDNILQDRDATMVKIADRMHNVSTLDTNFSEEAKQRKKEETKKYFVPFIQKAIEKYPDDIYFLNKALQTFKSL